MPMSPTGDHEGDAVVPGSSAPSSVDGGPPPPRTVPDAIRFRFDSVAVVEGAGPAASRTEGLTVVFDEQGVEITGPPQRGDQRLVRWADVISMSIGVMAPDPSGHVVLPVDMTLAGRAVLLLIGTDPLRTVQLSALGEWLARRPVPPLWSPWPAVAPAGAFPVYGTAPYPVAPYGTAPYPVAPYGTAPYPVAPYGTAPYPVAPYGSPYRSPAGAHDQTPPRGRRRRRLATLLVGIAFLLGAVGLAFGLSRPGARSTAVAPAAPRLSSDQRLADSLMLTHNDLPQGWSVSPGNSGSGNSHHDQIIEQEITDAFSRCMGITDDQGGVLLGGQAADQTAQSTSPIFIGPSPSAQPGYTLELQTAADIVRTHDDETSDLSLSARPGYPQCSANAVASELQLGVNDATGGNDQPGPATASVLSLPSSAGVQTLGLVITFTVSDRTTPLPVEVESVTLGSNRIEAQLQAFAVGGSIPSDALTTPLSTFEGRVVGQGKSVAV
jgi:hypothetical protein